MPCQPPSSSPGEQPRHTAQPCWRVPGGGSSAKDWGWGPPGRAREAAESGQRVGGREQEEKLKMEQQKPKASRGLECAPWPRCSASHTGRLGGLMGMVVGPAAPAHGLAWGCPGGWEAVSPSPCRLQGPSQGRGTQDPGMGSGMGSPWERYPPKPRGAGGAVGQAGQRRAGVPSSAPRPRWEPCRRHQQTLSGARGWGALPGPPVWGACLHYVRVLPGAALKQCPGGWWGPGRWGWGQPAALNSAPGAAECPRHWGDCLTPRDLPARTDVGEQPGPLTRAGAVGVQLRAGFGREQPKPPAGAGARACGSRGDVPSLLPHSAWAGGAAPHPVGTCRPSCPPPHPMGTCRPSCTPPMGTC